MGVFSLSSGMHSLGTKCGDLPLCELLVSFYVGRLGPFVLGHANSLLYV